MITAANPFLMFQGQCDEALIFYAATVPGARIVSLDKKPDGTVAMARLAVAGLEILANDSPPVHAEAIAALKVKVTKTGVTFTAARPISDDLVRDLAVSSLRAKRL